MKVIDERNKLRDQMAKEKKDEQVFAKYFMESCDKGDKVCKMVLELEDWKEMLNGEYVYTKQMMSPAKVINWKQLTSGHKALVQKAMARELAKMLQSQALRLCRKRCRERCSIPMRWFLTWKTLDQYADPSKEPQPEVIPRRWLGKSEGLDSSCWVQALDLAKRDSWTGTSLLANFTTNFVTYG